MRSEGTELFVSGFFCEAQHLEHLLLDIVLMDPDASASDLISVQHDIEAFAALLPGSVSRRGYPRPSSW